MRNRTQIALGVLIAAAAATSAARAQTPACGTFLFEWGSYCNIVTGDGCVDPDGAGPMDLGDGQFYGISALALDPAGTVYITEDYNNRVQKFDANGNFLTKWSGQTFYPLLAGIAADGAGNVYTTDRGASNRVRKFDSNGNLLADWGGKCVLSIGLDCSDPDGAGPLEFGDGQFAGPIGIEVDGAGNVYVADSPNSRIQKFDANGNFLAKWGSYCNLGTGDGCIDPDGAGPLSSGDGQFFYPIDAAIDGSGHVYALDHTPELYAPIHQSVQKFDANGNFLAKWGDISRRAHSIAADRAGNVFVGTDFGYIQVFDTNGTLLTQIGGPGTGGGQFTSAWGLAVDSAGHLYASDNRRIQILSCLLERTVIIDIKPGSEPNSINLSSSGVVPVAILSEPDFDAPAEVDPDTISLAGARVKMVGKSHRFLCHDEDVNADELNDLVCQVETAQFMIEMGDSVAVLEATTFGGTPIRGEGSIRIVPD